MDRITLTLLEVIAMEIGLMYAMVKVLPHDVIATITFKLFSTYDWTMELLTIGLISGTITAVIYTLAIWLGWR
jgi:archaellum biogenesis protein FlaJ (TadC family)